MLRQNLLTAYPKEVRLYYLDFPLESLHPWAKSAAMAGRCIFHQNASRLLGLSRLDFREPGRDQAGQPEEIRCSSSPQGKGLDADQLSKCIDSKATEEEVDKTKEDGARSGRRFRRRRCLSTGGAWWARCSGPI